MTVLEGRVMDMHIAGPPALGGEIHPAFQIYRQGDGFSIGHFESLNDWDILEPSIHGETPFTIGKLNGEIAGGLVDDRLLPIGNGGKQIVDVASVVVIAFTLHLSDGADPIGIGIEFDSGEELAGGRGMGEDFAVRWQANLLV